MIKPKEIIRVGFILFVITAISALLLAFANDITAPIIEKNNKIKTENSMKTLIPEADEFQEQGNAYIAKAGGETVGVCIISEGLGYGGTVQVMVGIDKAGKVAGVDILSHSETPGLGANADKPEFTNQFTGKTGNIKVTKGGSGENEINAISGATVTSNAVTGAVNEALSIAEEILGTGNGTEADAVSGATVKSEK